MDFARLFGKMMIVFPEFNLDDEILNLAMQRGWIEERDWKDFTRAQRLGKRFMRVSKRLDEKTILQRIMLVAPELMSRDAVDMLRAAGLISLPTAHALRAGFSAVNGIHAAAVSDKDIASRLFQLIDNVNSEDYISFLRNLDEERIAEIRAAFLRARLGPDWKSMPGVRLNKLESWFVQDKIIESIRRAEMLRAMVLAGKATNSAIQSAFKAHNTWDVMTIFAHTIFGPEFLRAAVKTGVIPPERFNLIRALESAGLNLWRKGTAAADYNSAYARWLLISEGVISPEMIKAVKELGWIDQEMAAYMNVAAKIVRGITRGQLENMGPRRKYRVTPGESPLRTYARVSKVTDGHILELLREAANESRVSAERAMKTALVGGKTRGAQQTLVAREMHKEMRSLAEKMGPLILFGEKEVAGAAVDSMEFLQKGILKRLTDEDQLSLRLTARSGLDNMLSRAENRHRLSRLVYRNLSAWNGRMDREINISLLRGLSAKEFANRIAHMVRPDVPGGVSYAAMRLARTEINNAFHLTQIRYTREMPWVEAYQWNLSGSHGKPDICNDMASKDHDGLGPGVYKKKDVPGKPHPHCLCFVTAVTKNPGEMEKQLLRGSYKKYFDTMRRGGLFDDPYAETASSVKDQFFNEFGPRIKKQGRDVAVALGASLVVSALRNPAAAAAFASNAMQGFNDLAERMAAGAKNATTRRAATGDWVRHELPPGADDFLSLPAGATVRGADDVDLSNFSAFVEAPRSVRQHLALVDWDDLEEIVDQWGLVRAGASVKALARTDLEDLLYNFIQRAPGAITEVIPGVTGAYVPDLDRMVRRLNDNLDNMSEVDQQQIGDAKSVYAGIVTYRVLNLLLREAKGNMTELASTIDLLMEQDDVGSALMNSLRLFADPDADSAARTAADAVVRQRIQGLDQIDMADLGSQIASYHKMLAHVVLDRFDEDSVRSMLDGGYTLGEWLTGGLQKMVRTGPVDEDLVVYRTSTAEFMGGKSPADSADLVGSVFTDWGVVSTEAIPRYFTQYSSWFGNVRYRIHIPKGTMVGMGSSEEFEVMLPPGSRFLTVKSTLGELVNEEGERVWDVDLLALPPQ